MRRELYSMRMDEGSIPFEGHSFFFFFFFPFFFFLKKKSFLDLLKENLFWFRESERGVRGERETQRKRKMNGNNKNLERRLEIFKGEIKHFFNVLRELLRTCLRWLILLLKKKKKKKKNTHKRHTMNTTIINQTHTHTHTCKKKKWNTINKNEEKKKQ